MKENFAADNNVYQPKIKIIGIGGCGLAVTNSLDKNLKNTEIFILDSDKKNLENSELDEKHKIQIGENLTNGLGCGGNPNVGEHVALESQNIIEKLVQDTDLVITVAGVAGGMGAGATPVITKIAKEQGATNIVFAVTPVKIEGERKKRFSDTALQKLSEEQTCVDAVVNVSNERFLNAIERDLTLHNLFEIIANETASGIEKIITLFQEGLISLNFNDFKKFMANAGYIGIGISEKTKDIETAIKETLDYPLIKGSFELAKKLILYVKGGKNISIGKVNNICREITKEIKDDTEMQLCVQIVDEFEEDEVLVTVITA